MPTFKGGLSPSNFGRSRPVAGKSQAYLLGKGAQKDGKKRVPAHDKNLMDLMRRTNDGEVNSGGASVKPMLDDWLKGWDDANLEPGDDPMRTEALDIVIKLRERDYTNATRLFTELMQQKVNKVLTEERRLLLVTEARELSVPERHQLKIAKQTLNMPDAMVGVMGSQTKEEAREIIKRLTGKTVTEAVLTENIASILKARVTTYKDSGQTIAHIEWRDDKGKTGTTSGDPDNTHMKALLDRAKREGVKVITEAVLTEAKVKCLECDKVFSANVKAGSEPKCPKCGGYDVELAEGFTKKALIRDPETPVGQPGKMHLMCVCGNKVDMPGGPATCSKCGQKYDPQGWLTEDYDNDDENIYGGRSDFAEPGGKSALRAGKRIYPCPTCKQPNKLTAKDKSHGYQCDNCADRDEGGMGY